MPDTAAQDDEQDFSIPGQDQEESLGVPPSALGGPQPPPAQPAPVTQSQNATATPSGPPPKASGRAMFLGNLLKTILSGVQNAPGNPNNAFDRGFQSASPQAQQQRAQQQQMDQAKVSQAQSAADIAKSQVALIPLKALQYEYQVKALPQQLQDEHLEQIQKHAEFFVKNGAEVVSTADDEKSADAATVQARANDPRSVQHLGMFLTMPDPEQDGKFSTMYFPNKELLQSDLKNADGKVLMKAGTPLVPAVGKALEDQQNDIKDFVKEMHGSLGNSKPPETQDAADQRLAQLNSFTSIAGKTDPVWTKLAQDETANIKKNYASLPKTEAAAKLAQAKATREDKPQDMVIGTLNGKQVAGTSDELKQAGATGTTKAGAAEAEKVNNARSLTSVFDSEDPDDPGLVQLAAKLDSEGKLGPAATRFAQWLNQGNTAANFNAGDPDVQRLFTKMGLATTGLMQVHVGARGSAQMLEHFEDLAKAKEMSPTAFRTALDTESRYVKMKAMRPEDTKKQTPQPAKKPAATDPFAQFGGSQRVQ